MDSVPPGDARQRLSGGDPAADFRQVAQHFLPPFAASGRASEPHAGRLAVRQRLARALGNKVALDLRGERKGESDDLRIDVIIKVKIVFDRVDADAARRTVVQNGHDHQHVASEPGDLRTHEQIVRLHPPDDPAEFAFGGRDGAGDGLLLPFPDDDGLFFRPLADFKFLAGAGLLRRTDPDVSVNHCLNVFPGVNIKKKTLDIL